MSQIEHFRIDGYDWGAGSHVMLDSRSTAHVVIPVEAVMNMQPTQFHDYALSVAREAIMTNAREFNVWLETPQYINQAKLPELQSYFDRFSLIQGTDSDVDHALTNLRWRIDKLKLRLEAEEKRDRQIRQRNSRGGQAGYVYLAYCETGHYKIGCSQDPETRIKHFDTQMPVKVDVVHWIQTDNMKRLESSYHNRFSHKRTKGEWFDLTEEDIDYIRGQEQVLFESPGSVFND